METPRRMSSKSLGAVLIRKDSAHNNPSSLHRVRLSSSRSGGRDRSINSPFPIVIQKRLSLAHYENEQTRLDWKRMLANAATDLDNLKVNF